MTPEILISDMPHKLNTTCNIAPTFACFVPNLAAHMLKRDYYKHTFDLPADLDLHNGIVPDSYVLVSRMPRLKHYKFLSIVGHLGEDSP
jgi:hypothetical protein